MFAVLALLGLWLAGGTGCGGGSNGDIALHYQVRVLESHFAVELTVTGSPGRRPELRLLDGWGLLQDMGSHIQDLTCEDGAGRVLPTQRFERDGEVVWKVTSRPRRGKLVVRYRVAAYEPTVSPEASFIGDRRFLALGYSLFLLPAGLAHNEPVEAKVTLDPGDLKPVWSSWTAGGGESPSTPHDLWSGVLAGGDYGHARLGSPPVTVTVLTGGGITAATGLSIANRLLPVLKETERFFGGPPRGDELHVLAVYRSFPDYGRQSILSGTSEENAFLCLATPDRFQDVEPLTALAAHECLHFYLGGAISADPVPPFRNAPEMAWLMEGMTEYLTYRLMAAAGTITPRRVRAVEAHKHAKYRSTPGWEELTVADAAARMHDLNVYGLVYSRGYLAAKLVAESLDACGEHGTRDLLRELFKEHNFYRQDPPVTVQALRDRMRRRCPQAWEVAAAYALGNEKLPAPAGGSAAE